MNFWNNNQGLGTRRSQVCDAAGSESHIVYYSPSQIRSSSRPYIVPNPNYPVRHIRPPCPDQRPYEFSNNYNKRKISPNTIGQNRNINDYHCDYDRTHAPPPKRHVSSAPSINTLPQRMPQPRSSTTLNKSPPSSKSRPVRKFKSTHFARVPVPDSAKTNSQQNFSFLLRPLINDTDKRPIDSQSNAIAPDSPRNVNPLPTTVSDPPRNVNPLPTTVSDSSSAANINEISSGNTINNSPDSKPVHSGNEDSKECSTNYLEQISRLFDDIIAHVLESRQNPPKFTEDYIFPDNEYTRLYPAVVYAQPKSMPVLEPIIVEPKSQFSEELGTFAYSPISPGKDNDVSKISEDNDNEVFPILPRAQEKLENECTADESTNSFIYHMIVSRHTQSSSDAPDVSKLDENMEKTATQNSQNNKSTDSRASPVKATSPEKKSQTVDNMSSSSSDPPLTSSSQYSPPFLNSVNVRSMTSTNLSNICPPVRKIKKFTEMKRTVLITKTNSTQINELPIPQIKITSLSNSEVVQVTSNSNNSNTGQQSENIPEPTSVLKEQECSDQSIASVSLNDSIETASQRKSDPQTSSGAGETVVKLSEPSPQPGSSDRNQDSTSGIRSSEVTSTATRDKTEIRAAPSIPDGTPTSSCSQVRTEPEKEQIISVSTPIPSACDKNSESNSKSSGQAKTDSLTPIVLTDNTSFESLDNQADLSPPIIHSSGSKSLSARQLTSNKSNITLSSSKMVATPKSSGQIQNTLKIAQVSSGHVQAKPLNTANVASARQASNSCNLYKPVSKTKVAIPSNSSTESASPASSQSHQSNDLKTSLQESKSTHKTTKSARVMPILHRESDSNDVPISRRESAPPMRHIESSERQSSHSHQQASSQQIHKQKRSCEDKDKDKKERKNSTDSSSEKKRHSSETSVDKKAKNKSKDKQHVGRESSRESSASSISVEARRSSDKKSSSEKKRHSSETSVDKETKNKSKDKQHVGRESSRESDNSQQAGDSHTNTLKTRENFFQDLSDNQQKSFIKIVTKFVANVTRKKFEKKRDIFGDIEIVFHSNVEVPLKEENLITDRIVRLIKAYQKVDKSPNLQSSNGLIQYPPLAYIQPHKSCSVCVLPQLKKRKSKKHTKCYTNNSVHALVCMAKQSDEHLCKGYSEIVCKTFTEARNCSRSDSDMSISDNEEREMRPVDLDNTESARKRANTDKNFPQPPNKSSKTDSSPESNMPFESLPMQLPAKPKQISIRLNSLSVASTSAAPQLGTATNVATTQQSTPSKECPLNITTTQQSTPPTSNNVIDTQQSTEVRQRNLQSTLSSISPSATVARASAPFVSNPSLPLSENPSVMRKFKNRPPSPQPCPYVGVSCVETSKCLYPSTSRPNFFKDQVENGLVDIIGSNGQDAQYFCQKCNFSTMIASVAAEHPLKFDGKHTILLAVFKDNSGEKECLFCEQVVDQENFRNHWVDNHQQSASLIRYYCPEEKSLKASYVDLCNHFCVSHPSIGALDFDLIFNKEDSSPIRINMYLSKSCAKIFYDVSLLLGITTLGSKDFHPCLLSETPNKISLELYSNKANNYQTFHFIFYCKLCSLTFLSFDKALQHFSNRPHQVKSVSMTQTSALPVSIPFVRGAVDITCVFCNKRGWPSLSTICHHIVSSHMRKHNEGLKFQTLGFQCNYCSQPPYDDIYNFLLHIQNVHLKTLMKFPKVYDSFLFGKLTLPDSNNEYTIHGSFKTGT